VNGSDGRPFRSVTVDHLVRGRTAVTWTLDRAFCDPGPWEAKLQWGHTGNPDADDWDDATPFQPDVGVLIDAWGDGLGVSVTGPRDDVLVDVASRDDLGINWRVHYRVVLKTSRAEYVSRPTSTLSMLDVKHWLRAQAIARRERLRMRLADAARGWLLKRKREGVVPDVRMPKQAVTSFLTGEPVRTRSAATAGTEFLGGYYAPVPFAVDFQPAGTHEERDGVRMRGTVDDRATMQSGRVVLDPPLAENDVFVVDGSDERFVVHEIRYRAIIRRIPVVADVDLRLAPRSDVVYGITVPDGVDTEACYGGRW
jgi:hypothetical protein